MKVARRRVPARLRRRWRRTRRRVRWGNLRKQKPVSDRFGFDRGTPIDRHYTDAFLATHARDVRGVVGEIADDAYARRYGSPLVERVEIIDVDASNPRATIIADLANEDELPASAFDCLIVTQTLQYTADPLAALRNCAAALRPGGTLLLAVPALTPHDAIEPDDSDRWRFWPAGLRSLVEEAFPNTVIEVEAHGNLVVATAFLQGIAAEELRPAELAAHDMRYPIVVHARVVMP